MTTLEHLIKNYGYLAVMLGTFLEGETVLVLAGIAAHLGYLKLSLVVLAAFIGALSGDLLYFFLGRWHGPGILLKHPQWQTRIDKLQKLLARYHSPLILMSRFLYGLRMVAPFALGLGHVPPGKYLLLDATSVLVWTVAVAAGGYLFGNFLEIIIGDIKRYELLVMGAIAAVGILIGVIYYYRRRKYQDS
ncbi:MAG: DedA family protein [Desulfobaccales bacterium]|nr:DedA family protein [Desulfobaccales bacterium]